MGREGATAARLAAGVPERSQRERLIDAMIALAARGGYASASVARVCAAAGVSSATFYEQFNDREDCLLAAYRTLATHVLEQTQPPGTRSAGNSADGERELHNLLGRVLVVFEKDPDGARVLLLESIAAGGGLEAERALLEKALERTVTELLDSAAAGAPLPDLPAQALIGAVRNVIIGWLLADTEGELAALADEIVDWVQSYTRPDNVRWSTGPHAHLASPQPRRAAAAPARPILPRGSHGLPAQVVTRSQRERILCATAEVMMRNGYADSTVTEVVSKARISRQVFYANFTNKRQALLEAQQAASRRLLEACEAAACASQDWPTRIWQGLRALLDLIAANPAFSHLCLIDCYAAGPDALSNAHELPGTVTHLLDEGHRIRPQARELPGLCSQLTTGAILQVIQRHVARGQTPTLPQRLPQLAYIAIAPYTGPAKAAEIIEQLGKRE